MVCQTCGAAMAGDVQFCSKCGAQAVAAYPVYAYPPAAYVSRVQQHVRTLGILWCVYGAYRIVRGIVAIALIGAFTTHGFAGEPFFWGRFGGAPWMHALIPIIGVMTVVWAALALLVGYSLLTRRPWGRVLALVVAVLSLIRIPLGTVLGIYTLWVLASGPSGMEYDAIADGAE